MRTAREIVAALGGRWHGTYGMALCPCHDDGATPALKVKADRRKPDGIDLVCFAGCRWQAVKAELRRLGLLGDWRTLNGTPQPPRERAPRGRDLDGARRVALANKIWRESVPIQCTPAERYLRNRGLMLPIPPTLRYHPGLRYDNASIYLPAMVAYVQGVDQFFVGVHRTFLLPDGRGKAPVAEPRKSLGAIGGGAVRLAATAETLAVSEGVETALSVQQAAAMPTWAALSTSGLVALRLPPLVRHVVICADRDANGAGERAASEAAKRFLEEGRTVRIAFPPTSFKDFNDVLCAEALREGAA